MTNKKELREKAAKDEIHAVCEKLYEDGLTEYKKFTIRRIRNLRLELFGQGGHQDSITHFRDEWFENKGLIEQKTPKESLDSSGDIKVDAPNSPRVQNAVESFLTEQRKTIAHEVQLQFTDKISALEQALTKSHEQCYELQQSFNDEQENSAQKQRQIDGVSELMNSFTSKIEKLTEEKIKAIQLNESVKVVKDELEQEKKLHGALKLKFNEFNKAYKWQVSKGGESEKSLIQLTKKHTQLTLKVGKLEEDKKVMSTQHQNALQDLKRFKEWREEEVKKEQELARHTAKINKQSYNELFKTVRQELERIHLMISDNGTQFRQEQLDALQLLKNDAQKGRDELKSELSTVKSSTFDLKDSLRRFDEFVGCHKKPNI